MTQLCGSLQADIKHKANAAHLAVLADLRIGEGGGRAGKNCSEEEYPQGDARSRADVGDHGRGPGLTWAEASGPNTVWSR